MRERASTCPSAAWPTYADTLEVQVRELIAQFSLEGYLKERLLAQLRDERPEREQQNAKIESRLRRLRDLYELGDIERDDYVRRRDELNADLDAIRPLRTRSDEQRVKLLLDVLDDVRERWFDLPAEERRDLLRIVVERVTVDNGSVASVRVRPEVASILAAMESLPRKAPYKVRPEVASALAAMGSRPHMTQV